MEDKDGSFDHFDDPYEVGELVARMKTAKSRRWYLSKIGVVKNSRIILEHFATCGRDILLSKRQYEPVLVFKGDMKYKRGFTFESEASKLSSAKRRQMERWSSSVRCEDMSKIVIARRLRLDRHGRLLRKSIDELRKANILPAIMS